MSESKCPFHGATTQPNLGTQNKDWWPNHLNLDILRQHDTKSNPIQDIDYRDKVKSLDIDAVKKDIVDAMHDSKDGTLQVLTEQEMAVVVLLQAPSVLLR